MSTTSLSSEVVRGLGYWYFYGGDNFGPGDRTAGRDFNFLVGDALQMLDFAKGGNDILTGGDASDGSFQARVDNTLFGDAEAMFNSAQRSQEIYDEGTGFAEKVHAEMQAGQDRIRTRTAQLERHRGSAGRFDESDFRR